MDGIKGSLEIAKEFFLEILGFLLPGICLITTFYFISSEIQQTFFNKFVASDKFVYFYIVLGYVAGYFIYGIGQLKYLHSNLVTNTAQIEKSIEDSEIFILVHKHLEERMHQQLSKKLRDIRNLAMSCLQDFDRKIYNFTFRSELCHSLSIVALFTGIGGLFTLILSKWIVLPIRNDRNFIIFYFFLMFCWYAFQKARNKFYKISLILIFPIYASNFINRING